MSSRAALAAAVASAPDDDLPKLVFADWLDENGDPDRAEFVRLSVAVHREGSAFPPTPDQAKLARIRTLFEARHRDWLRPVYHALAQPLPTFTATQGRWSVQSLGGVVVSHSDGPMSHVVFHAGLMSMLSLQPARLPPTASLAAAMTHEPLEVLHLTLPGTLPGLWEDADGPHLARVRTLSVQVRPVRGDDVRPLAEVLFDPARFSGLRTLTVTPEILDDDGPPGTALFDTLCASPLRSQLTTLSLYDLPARRLLARHDHGFDTLRELAVGARGQPGGATTSFAGGVSDWFRERLTRLVIDTSASGGLGWLTVGEPWQCLEKLLLSGGALDDAGASALARSNTLPALRELRLSGATVSPAGATVLATSPLVTGLRALFLDGSAVGDVGAARLATALDAGLGYLSLRFCQPAISPQLVRDLTTLYGPRIAFA